METKDLIIYGALIYLLYKITKQKGCNCENCESNTSFVNLTPGRSVLNSMSKKDCLNCDYSNMGISNLTSLPIFAKVNKQVQPTPASILDPQQIAFYNKKAIKGISPQTYIC